MRLSPPYYPTGYLMEKMKEMLFDSIVAIVVISLWVIGMYIHGIV